MVRLNCAQTCGTCHTAGSLPLPATGTRGKYGERVLNSHRGGSGGQVTPPTPPQRFTHISRPMLPLPSFLHLGLSKNTLKIRKLHVSPFKIAVPIFHQIMK